MYLRVIWLDQNGSNNFVFGDKAFNRSQVLNAPGIIYAIAQGANALELDFAVLRQRFITCGQREVAAISPLKPDVTHEAAWAGFEADLKTAVDSGTRWRKPKGA